MVFAQQFGITGTDASALAALRALSSAPVFNNGRELTTRTASPPSPAVPSSTASWCR